MNYRYFCFSAFKCHHTISRELSLAKMVFFIQMMNHEHYFIPTTPNRLLFFCESLLSQLANKPKQTIAQRIETVITQTLTSIPKHRHLTESTETAKQKITKLWVEELQLKRSRRKTAKTVRHKRKLNQRWKLHVNCLFGCFRHFGVCFVCLGFWYDSIWIFMFRKEKKL